MNANEIKAQIEKVRQAIQCARTAGDESLCERFIAEMKERNKTAVRNAENAVEFAEGRLAQACEQLQAACESVTLQERLIRDQCTDSPARVAKLQEELQDLTRQLKIAEGAKSQERMVEKLLALRQQIAELESQLTKKGE